ncbi:MAG: lactoylglutathione lyase [Flavobacteriales bacterium]|nr:lactoylglutathione lyase [Flavobacteriales bacterium]
MENMKEVLFILYVANQEKSKLFYQKLLDSSPSLDVPGMTEFTLVDGVKLGLMPEIGIAKILTDKTPHPKLGSGIPRCELYLKVKNAEEYIKRGILIGGKEISSLKDRDWGDKVAYLSDLDGHIIAIAEII